MRVEYHRKFSHFVDMYLTGYFSTGSSMQTFKHLLGGPLLMIGGALLFNLVRGWGIHIAFKILLSIPLWAAILGGAGYMLLPGINILLVWLRREKFLGQDDALISLELKEKALQVDEPEGPMEIPFENITSIQRGTNSSWIMTKPDNIIYVPREGLVSGEHDAFIDALDAILESRKPKKTSALLWD